VSEQEERKGTETEKTNNINCNQTNKN